MILAIDDDRDLLDLMALLLEDAGHEVMRAGNGAEALDQVRERMPDLVLLDMKMPFMNGWEFASEYRAHYGAHPDVAPIVVVTAAEHAGKRAHEVGAQGFLAKPFTRNDLLDAVRRFARRRDDAPRAGC